MRWSVPRCAAWSHVCTLTPLAWPRRFWRSTLIGVVYMSATGAGSSLFRRTSEHNFRKVVLWLLLGLALAGLLV